MTLNYAYQLFLNYRSSFLKFLVVGPCRGMTNAIIDMAIQPIRQYSQRTFIHNVSQFIAAVRARQAMVSQCASLSDLALLTKR